MTIASDRDRLLDELKTLELRINETELWTVEVSLAIIRRDKVRRLLKMLGKKDWF